MPTCKSNSLSIVDFKRVTYRVQDWKLLLQESCHHCPPILVPNLLFLEYNLVSFFDIAIVL